MSNSKRKCAMCKERFKTDTGLIRGPLFFCSPDHLVDYASANVKALANKQRDKRAREFKKETVRRKKDLLENDRSHQLKLAQQNFNKYIRLRDKGKPCISCGKPDNGEHQRHASHYRSVGACSSLRFNELNVWASCSVCNNHLSGNIGEYRLALIDKIGLEKVEWLESQPKQLKISIEEIISIKEHYAKLVKSME